MEGGGVWVGGGGGGVFGVLKEREGGNFFFLGGGGVTGEYLQNWYDFCDRSLFNTENGY